MLEIKIASTQEIEDSRDQWNSLVLSMDLPSIFLTWDWITTWITHFGANYKIIILFIYDEDNLVGILPLAQKTMRLDKGLFNLNVLTICGGFELYPDHFDLIHLKSSNVDSIVDQILNFLDHNFRTWNLLYFPFLTEEGVLCTYLRSHGMREYRMRTAVSSAPFISNEKDFDTFFKKLKRKKRYNLNRERKKLFSIPTVNVSKINGNINNAELDKALSELFGLHELRADKKGILSTFTGKKIYDFHRDILSRFHKNGWLRLHFIRDSDHPVAAAYGFVFDRRYSYYQSGMDPDWERFSPGKILILEIIKNEFNRGTLEFDFLGGDNKYKTFWTGQARQLFSFSLYNKNFAGMAEYFYWKFRDLVKYCLKKQARS